MILAIWGQTEFSGMLVYFLWKLCLVLRIISIYSSWLYVRTSDVPLVWDTFRWTSVKVIRASGRSRSPKGLQQPKSLRTRLRQSAWQNLQISEVKWRSGNVLATQTRRVDIVTLTLPITWDVCWAVGFNSHVGKWVSQSRVAVMTTKHQDSYIPFWSCIV